MSHDTTSGASPARPSWIERFWESFVRWYRRRPFWGGLFLIVAGFVLFGSGNLDLTNVQVHLGVTGFLSYIVPLFVVLCGALVWASPSQRIFYGILGNAAAVYSIVSVNLGGFVLGMLFGIIGGSLAAAWVPDKAALDAPRATEPPAADLDDILDSGSAAGADRAGADPADAYSPSAYLPGDDSTGAHAATEPAAADDAPTSRQAEGKQRLRFPRPRHAEQKDREEQADQVERGVESGPLTSRRRRTVSFAVVVLVFSAVAVITLHPSAPAAAADCAPPPTLSQLVKSATARAAKPKAKVPHSPATKPASTTKSSNATKPTSATKPGSDGSTSHTAGSVAVAAKAPAAQPKTSRGPLGGLLGAIGALLGDASPSDSPSEAPSPSPSATDPTDPPSAPPSRAPHPPASPTKKPPPPKASGPATAPTTAPPCDVVAKSLAVDPGQVDVQEEPSIQTTALLTMHGLSFDGITDLPTKTGTITVMQFSMNSAISTPFQLDASVKGQTIRYNASTLTVSGNVKFYATEFKGNAEGVLPGDYTPDNPPPVVLSEMFFTDVTIGLVDVTSDTLTSDKLDITLPA